MQVAEFAEQELSEQEAWRENLQPALALETSRAAIAIVRKILFTVMILLSIEQSLPDPLVRLRICNIVTTA